MITIFNEYLKEDAECVYKPGETLDKNDGALVYYYDEDARAFGIWDDPDSHEKMLVGTHHLHYHCDLVDREGNGPGDRWELKYAGRLWLDSKIISFWWHPPKEEFDDFLEILAEELDFAHNNLVGRHIDKYNGVDFSDPEWRVEVVVEPNGEWEEGKYFSRLYRHQTDLIPLKKYSGSEKWDEETLMKIHTLPPEQKRQMLLDMGYKPKRIKTPKGMSQAQYRNKVTRFKYTESFATFENTQNEKWSVKRYGNSHAVFYDGQIVGFDDKEIGDEFNVESELFNVELIYSIDEKSEEILPIYVCKNVWKIFDLVDQFDISPAVKQIAQKMAEKMYRQGFYIRVI